MLTATKMNRRQFGLLASAAALSSSLSFHSMAQDGATFVLASNTELDNMDPHTANGNIPTAFFINIYDSLVRVRHNPPVIEPGLAFEWSISDDGLVYTFKLQPDAVFHDGSPVTADAVVYSIERLVRLDGSRSSPGHGLGLSMVAAIASAHGGAVSALASQTGAIVELELPVVE